MFTAVQSHSRFPTAASHRYRPLLTTENNAGYEDLASFGSWAGRLFLNVLCCRYSVAVVL